MDRTADMPHPGSVPSGACPCCGQPQATIFYESTAVPVNSCILLPSADEARAYPLGDVRLAFCDACGFIFNSAFRQELAEYSERYEETQGFSPTFQAFHTGLVQRLIDRYDLHDKDIVEIGCGKGEFLNLICELGGNRGVGFDPSYHAGRNDGTASSRIRFVRDFYSERYADESGDFVCCKMTLEHIHDAHSFIATVRRSVGDRENTVVYFLVPDTQRIVEDCALEDIYYEHCSYFTAGSLRRLFARTGFTILDVHTEFGGQYLSIEAKPTTLTESLPVEDDSDLAALAEQVRSFGARAATKRDEWRSWLNDPVGAKGGGKVVLWGSGSKAVAFLSVVSLAGAIEHVVDINPYRQGCFMPSTAQSIVAPGFLAEYRPDRVIVMNRMYREEIAADLAEMGLTPDIVAL